MNPFISFTYVRRWATTQDRAQRDNLHVANVVFVAAHLIRLMLHTYHSMYILFIGSAPIERMSMWDRARRREIFKFHCVVLSDIFRRVFFAGLVLNHSVRQSPERPNRNRKRNFPLFQFALTEPHVAEYIFFRRWISSSSCFLFDIFAA